jgi:Mn2+/Fe2+ NRAMP family transporter
MAGERSESERAAYREAGVEEPPRTIAGILRRLGPGLIVAGSIVGSGELIATTAVGAEAGFWLLWIILIGCVIKVFTQIELGRYSITCGQTTMEGMNVVPGPALEIASRVSAGAGRARGSWLVWYWFLMFTAGIGQLGGIVGGVGQALSISLPLTETGRRYNAALDAETELTVEIKELEIETRRLLVVAPAHPSDVKELRKEIEGSLDGDPEVASLFRARLEKRLAALEAESNRDWPRSGLAWRTVFELATWRETAGTWARHRALSLVTASAGALSQLDSQQIDKLRAQVSETVARLAAIDAEGDRPAKSYDDRIWAAIVTVFTAFILVVGRYGLIQLVSTAMVFAFTVITLGNVVSLQATGAWAVSWSELLDGLKLRMPPLEDARVANPLRTALFTFGIIGVGASELVSYPYWCLEKGYARFAGPRDDSPAWAERARGWMRVMRWDAWCSMVVYTAATVAFYLLGAAILWRTELDPGGTELVRTLSVMYEPVFGPWAQVLFLFGAFAVLYSTFFVANASHARVFSDALRVLGLGIRTEAERQRWVKVLSGVFPFLCLSVYLYVQAPKTLVLTSGMMQAIMLPMLAGAALYFRFRRSDPRLRPGRAWDVWLCVSALGMLISGAAAIYTLFF